MGEKKMTSLFWLLIGFIVGLVFKDGLVIVYKKVVDWIKKLIENVKAFIVKVKALFVKGE
jgi:hypothetical protein